MRRAAWVLASVLLGCGPAGVSGAVGETGSETSDPSETGVFVPLPDIAGSCEILVQDCPVGEKCVPYASGGENYDRYECVPILGDQPAGEACRTIDPFESTDDCDLTNFCLNSICRPFCAGSIDQLECPERFFCLVASNFSMLVCVPHCDPIGQDCEEDRACHWDGSAFLCLPDAGLGLGEPCGFVNDCDAGLLCIAGEALPSCASPACCTAYCDLSIADGGCEAQLPGSACLPLFVPEQAPAGLEDIGVCMIPG